MKARGLMRRLVRHFVPRGMVPGRPHGMVLSGVPGRILTRALLLPILPGFLWGPFTHPYINTQALRLAREKAKKGEKVNLQILSTLERNRDAFINAANTADAISTYHILNGVSVYNYSHNHFPLDTAKGTPTFGYSLVNLWREDSLRLPEERRYTEKDLVAACGWLSHQLADWYVHYACITYNGELNDPPDAPGDGVNTFSGYSNSHRVFGANFARHILESYEIADHAALEFLFDVLMLDEFPQFARTRVELFETRHGHNLLTDTSELFAGCVRIDQDHIPHLEKNFNAIIVGIRILDDILTALRPGVVEEVREIFYQQGGGREFLEGAIMRVVDWLFAKDFDEIKGLAEKRDSGHGATGPGRIVGVRIQPFGRMPGTILFELAYQFGASLRFSRVADELHSFLKGPPYPLRVISRLAAKSLALGILRRLQALGGNSRGRRKDPARDALLSFLSMLLISRPGSIQDARNAFRKNLKPMIILEGGEAFPGGGAGWDPSTREAIKLNERLLAQMLRKKRIAFRAVSAAQNRDAIEEDRVMKKLDPSTIAVRIDGYDDKRFPEMFTIEYLPASDDPYGDLLIYCLLNADVLSGHHHIFADIRDAVTNSRYLDWEVEVRRAGGRIPSREGPIVLIQDYD